MVGHHLELLQVKAERHCDPALGLWVKPLRKWIEKKVCQCRDFAVADLVLKQSKKKRARRSDMKRRLREREMHLQIGRAHV